MWSDVAFAAEPKLNVNCCDAPDPVDGVTVSPVGGGGGDCGAVDVNVPMLCQLPCWALPEYHVDQIVLLPANDAANVTLAVTEMLPPAVLTDTVEAGTLHWLFESVPLPP